VIDGPVLVTARKGTFGHGMSSGGGWELTAQYLGSQRGELLPTVLREAELNPEIAKLHDAFVFDRGSPDSHRSAGKLSMGIGGVNACVVSRPLDAESPAG
jgi:3-oxoacyl-(acyl-carrier-protein) synthase